jgi:lipopolysaccharide export LptBFGC system permease protein LptF
MGAIKKTFLKRIVASSLTEVIVATVLLMLVFGIALATLNSILISSAHGDTHKMETKMQQLVYQYANNGMKIPLDYKEDNLTITIKKIKQNTTDFVAFRIVNNITKKERYQKIIDNEY